MAGSVPILLLLLCLEETQAQGKMEVTMYITILLITVSPACVLFENVMSVNGSDA